MCHDQLENKLITVRAIVSASRRRPPNCAAKDKKQTKNFDVVKFSREDGGSLEAIALSHRSAS
jgi:hypothetical protein